MKEEEMGRRRITYEIIFQHPVALRYHYDIQQKQRRAWEHGRQIGNAVVSPLIKSLPDDGHMWPNVLQIKKTYGNLKTF
jgi:hypothetical protein